MPEKKKYKQVQNCDKKVIIKSHHNQPISKRYWIIRKKTRQSKALNKG